MGKLVTAAEIATAINISARAVRLRASEQNWRSEVLPGRAHALAFHLDSLPQDVRIALAARSATTADVAVTGAPVPAVLTPTASCRLDAKLQILTRLAQFQSDTALEAKAARATFVELYNAGRIEGFSTSIKTLSVRSVERWTAQSAKEGVARLAGRFGRKRGSEIDADPEIRALVAGVLAIRPHASSAAIMQALRARFPAGERKLPAYRSVQRYLAQRKAEPTFEFTANPDAWKGRRRVAFGSQSDGITRLNQVWELDATPADVMLADGRHAVVGVIDVWSRRAMTLVSKTSKSTAIAALMRRAILAWGVPEMIKTDQGKDFTSVHLTRVVANLKIAHRVCPPFTPEGKPHIERFFGSMARGLFETLPGYIGHNVADRTAIRARASFAERFGNQDGAIEVKLSAAELQQTCDAWCASLYGHEPHNGLAGLSPFQKAATWTGQIRRVDDERALDALLAEAPDTHGVRVVGKKGVRLDGTWFIAPQLGALVGHRVHVRLDPADMGRIWLFDPEDGRFLCQAEAPERTGIDRQVVAIEAKRLQRAIVLEARREGKLAARAVKAGDIAQDVLNGAIAESARVVAFPQATEPHETPALAEFAEAARSNQPRAAAPLTAEEQEAAERAWAEMEARRAPTVRLGPDGRNLDADDREHALWLIANPDKQDDGDRAWLRERLERKSFRDWLGLDEEAIEQTMKKAAG